jgi:hypothetical protein
MDKDKIDQLLKEIESMTTPKERAEFMKKLGAFLTVVNEELPYLADKYKI